VNPDPDPLLVFAPMATVSHAGFRQLTEDWGGCSLYFTEMIDAGTHLSGRRFEEHYADASPCPEKVVFQVVGARPRGLPVGRCRGLAGPPGFDGIDINMGCPAEKVVRRGECSGLIDRPGIAGELIQAAQEAAGGFPVSVKTRLGVKARRTLDWAAFLLGFDLPMLTIHGRIAAQMSEGEADWDEVRRVRQLRDELGKATLITGNGDLFSADDLDRRYAETGVDGLMVGRGIFRDPDIFRLDRPHRSFDAAPWADRRDTMVAHTVEHRRVWGGVKGFDMLKQFYKCYTRGPEEYLALRTQLFEARSYEAALEAIAAWDSRPDRLP